MVQEEECAGEVRRVPEVEVGFAFGKGGGGGGD